MADADTPVSQAQVHAATEASPSDWLVRWLPDLPPGARVLDLACGRGRHARWLAARGLHVTAIDRDGPALAALQASAPGIDTRCADLETGPWPLAGEQFSLVLISNYLWRPRRAEQLACVAPGGTLIHETFGAGQARIGRPSRPEFLLRTGELQAEFTAPHTPGGPWQVLAFEDLFLEAPARFVQRIVARRGQGPAPGLKSADCEEPV